MKATKTLPIAQRANTAFKSTAHTGRNAALVSVLCVLFGLLVGNGDKEPSVTTSNVENTR